MRGVNNRFAIALVLAIVLTDTVAAGTLYFHSGDTVRIRMRRTDHVGGTTHGPSTPRAQRLNVDLIENKLYWAEFITSPFSYRIHRSNLDFSEIEVFLEGSDRFRELSVDVTGIYVTHGDGDYEEGFDIRLTRYDRDGSNATDILTNLFPAPGIAIDSVGGHVYYLESPAYHGARLRRANLDGTGVIELVPVFGELPGRLGIDRLGGKIYYSSGSDTGHSNLYRVNLDGTSRELVLASGGGFAIDSVARVMYRAQHSGSGYNSVWKMDLDTLESEFFHEIYRLQSLALDPRDPEAVPAVSYAGLIALLALFTSGLALWHRRAR